MNIVLLDSKDWQKMKPAQRDEISDVVQKAANSAVEALGDLLSSHVNVLIHPELPDNVIPETGEGGWTHNSELVRLYFDPDFPHGYSQYLEQLAHTTHHELHHAARFHSAPYDNRLVSGAINEGLATVFERDVSGAKPLWGEYDSDDIMTEWLGEVVNAGEDWSKWSDLAFSHPDGRRWIAYRSGTWLVDRIMATSGKSLRELTTMRVDKILTLGS